MRYLVTGGAGFIGSHLAAHLSSRGNEVIILDNFSSGKRGNVDALPVRVIEADIRDFDAVVEATEGVNTVFHQAALCSVPASVDDPRAAHEINATGTLNLLQACRKNWVRRVVMASSSAVYGDSEALPKHEDMATDPLSPYAISKLVGEHYCRVFWKLYGVEAVALRYFNVFGPGQAPDSEYAAVVPKFMQAVINGEDPVIHGDGHQTRDFTYIDNVVQANLLAAVSERAPGQVMNVACGTRLSLLELVEHLERIRGISLRPVHKEARPGDVKHSQASIERARDLIGFEPRAEFSRGLKETFDWYQESMTGQAAMETDTISVAR